MGLLTSWFGWGAKERERRDARVDEQLSMASPKAAVGADLAAGSREGETETALRKAANSNDPVERER